MQEFDGLRAHVGAARPPVDLGPIDRSHYQQMTPADGLQTLQRCAFQRSSCAPIGNTPTLTDDVLDERHLWVVRQDDVVGGEERGTYGQKLTWGVIKHTNLTGGDPAFSGGELIYWSDNEIVINGCSGRYGPRSEAEMQLVEQAFTKLGYLVWTMGYDDEAKRPIPFGPVDPYIVA